jgi:hypothetical protein
MRLALVPVVCCLIACGHPSERIGSAEQPVIYGADDRVEIASLHPDDPIRATGVAQVAAMVPSNQVHSIDDVVNLSGPTWADDRELCDGVAFADQPVLAHCTAVLLGDDLVLTAGHCAKLCSSSKIVFGVYYDEPGALHPIASSDVYDCADVIVDTWSPGVDFAWLRLDRAVSGAERPATARLSPPPPGEALALVSFPGGIPMKADLGGCVTTPGEGIFYTSHDAFQSSSGAPLLDELGQVVGVLAGGAPDLVATPEGCNEPLVIDSDDGVERATIFANALRGLCEPIASDPLCAAHGYDGPPDEAVGGCSLAADSESRSHGWLLIASWLACARVRRKRCALRQFG